MGLRYQVMRVTDMLRATKLAGDVRKTDEWPRAKLLELQQSRLRALVRHAVAHSPWHRERLARFVDKPDLNLADLPTMDKASMMANFDRAVCDPRLTLKVLDEHAANLRLDDELLFNEYRVFATSGTSGVRAYFAFDRQAWAWALSAYPRISAQLGFRPRLPRVRMAQGTASGPMHMTYRFAITSNIGVYRTLRFNVTEPISNIAAKLQQFQPDAISTYPSIAAMLADEQLDGRLKISPQWILTSSEQTTPDMLERIKRAWGQVPYNIYASTETAGALAAECPEHSGMHLFEDRVIVEALNAAGQPVADGEQGEKMLVTNLTNFSQPVIRYELSDRLTLSSKPCACGRPTLLITDIGGRAEDVFQLKSTSGMPVPVHPNHFLEPIGETPWVRQYRVGFDGTAIDVVVIPRQRVEREQIAQLEHKLDARLRKLGAEPPPIGVRIVDNIPRAPGPAGKHKLIQLTGVAKH